MALRGGQAHSGGRCSVQVDDQVHEYQGNTNPTHGLTNAFLSTESNTAFKSTTCSGCWNSVWIFANKRNAKIASSVERQRVNPDW